MGWERHHVLLIVSVLSLFVLRPPPLPDFIVGAHHSLLTGLPVSCPSPDCSLFEPEPNSFYSTSPNP